MLLKRTTRDIIGDYIDNEQRFDYVEKSSDHVEKEDLDLYIKNKETLQTEIRTKMDKVDSFVLETKRKEHLIDAEVDALKNEIDRLKQRRKGIGMFKKFVNDILLPMVVKEVGNEDGVWETDTARYKLYESYGGVIVNPDMVSSDFKKVEIKESIDKVKARKAAIAAHRAGENMPDGIEIRKVERVRRT
tara:strand:+ start:920 stop:1486 length:567 start_codon:yes stop_codon:yes gene_type:complete